MPRWRKRQPNRRLSSAARRKKTRTRRRLAKLVVGLGNPGPKYAGTRHNVGFDVVDALAGDSRWTPTRHYDVASVTIRSRPVSLIKPTTFMNDSGVAVRAALDVSTGAIRDILVLVDDIHLDVGRTRVRRSGSDGGHNGLRSILANVESDSFARVRLGVGSVPDGSSQIEHVLGRFDGPESGLVDKMILRGSEAVRAWCGDGVEVAMNQFNGK